MSQLATYFVAKQKERKKKSWLASQQVEVAESFLSRALARNDEATAGND
jgi:hypothetical protein